MEPVLPFDPSDHCLVWSIQQNDKTEFEYLYKKYWKVLTRFAYGYIHNYETAKEIVQELFVQLYYKGLRLKVPASLDAYLHRALRNRIINYMRNEGVYQKHLQRAGRIERFGVNEAVEMLDLNDIKKKIRSSLSRMPENCRLVFLLNKEQRLTIKQIAARLQKSENTVEKQLSRSVHFLRSSLKNYL
jgi:RNA polymerase sigma-70 factor (family 1)